MYAASWERERKAWNFDGDGNNSAIYKSTDAGDTWKNISVNNGFRNGNGVGRIGLSIYDENTVYAIHDSQFRRKFEKKEKKSLNGLKKEDFKKMSTEEFLALTDKNLNNYLRANRFQKKYSAKTVKNMVSKGTVKPIDLAKFLEDANSMLFDTPVEGAEVFITTNGGKKWSKTHNNQIDGLYYSYGYYFANISVDVKNQNRIYMGGVPLIFSEDGGKSFSAISKENVHADHHVTWINPENPNHIINGNDGGVNISYDNGENWIKCNNEALGQLYAVNVDDEEEYNVYGGLQDNGVWVGTHNYEKNVSWHQEGKYPYEELMGGDGMQIQIDNRNSNIVYTGFQFGNYYKIDRKNNSSESITPKSPKGEKPFRFNWQTPILLSSHNQDVIYLGSNFLHRSMNQGKNWAIISDDLTYGEKEGNVAFGTLTTISESKFQFGLLYVGSDDGKIHVSKDAGNSWQLISGNLPQNFWVSRVVASAYKKERVYATLNGYRNDNFSSYVYVSEDFGATWTSISNGLTQAVNVIVEDSENENVLYVGTDNGLFVSLDKGNTWQDFSNEIPNVAIHDLKIQAKAKELIVATHGRSIYKIDISKKKDFEKIFKKSKNSSSNIKC